MFIIYKKNGNKTSLQPILKSNSTYFRFSNIFYEINIMKSYPLLEWGNGSNFFLEVDLILELNLVHSTEQC